MKYFIFYREDDDFNDILQDQNTKKLFDLKIKFNQHLILGGDEIPDDLQSYIMLKYGDDIKNPNHIFIDRKPVPFKDYLPNNNRPEKFKKL